MQFILSELWWKRVKDDLVPFHPHIKFSFSCSWRVIPIVISNAFARGGRRGEGICTRGARRGKVQKLENPLLPFSTVHSSLHISFFLPSAKLNCCRTRPFFGKELISAVFVVSFPKIPKAFFVRKFALLAEIFQKNLNPTGGHLVKFLF